MAQASVVNEYRLSLAVVKLVVHTVHGLLHSLCRLNGIYSIYRSRFRCFEADALASLIILLNSAHDVSIVVYAV